MGGRHLGNLEEPASPTPVARSPATCLGPARLSLKRPDTRQPGTEEVFGSGQLA